MNSDEPIVFVVDDDHRVREALSSLIASVGLRVVAFASTASIRTVVHHRQTQQDPEASQSERRHVFLVSDIGYLVGY
jgi:hypothetical protein